MVIKPIKTASDYHEALKRLEGIFDSQDETPESDEADILGSLVDEYEQKFFPIDAPELIEAIKIRFELSQ
jgi:HTH-type transcriptional regulator/antitoxin HigA